MNTSIFVSNHSLIASQAHPDQNLAVAEEGAFRNLLERLQKKEQLKDPELVELLLSLFSTLKSTKKTQLETVIEETGFSILYEVLSLINHEKDGVRSYAYALAQSLCYCLDIDELAANMMDQLICMNWEESTDNEEQFYMAMRSFAVCFELFGRGLEKMTRARDWMLFLPFMANYMTKILDTIGDVLPLYSALGGNMSAEQTSLTKWDKGVILVVNNCLDFIQFIHEKTVSSSLSDFPFDTTNIGEENGDSKRQYLGYYLLCLLYENVYVNLNMQLSQSYFRSFHQTYNIKWPYNKGQPQLSEQVNDIDKAKSDIVWRIKKLSKDSGLTLSKLYRLRESLAQKKQTDLSAEDEAYENDRQIINSRLYPLRPTAVAGFFALALAEKLFDDTDEATVLFDETSLDSISLAQKYVGILLNLLLGQSELVSRLDKGIFSLLYIADHVTIHFKAIDLEELIPGPNGGTNEVPALHLLEILSSVAATCPNSSLRFYAYKLIEKGLESADDEACLHIVYELLDRCPYSSMNTAAVGLLKDQISRAIDSAKYQQVVSIFATPLVKSKFFPIIFKFKSAWKDKPETLWEDYNYIMQGLNLYYLLLSKDYPTNLTYVWKKDSIDSVNQNYIRPILNLLNSLEIDEEDIGQIMQRDTIKHVIDKIDTELQNRK